MTGEDVSGAIFFLVTVFIRAIFIPGILIALVRQAWIIANTSEHDREEDTSKHLSFWLGVAIFTLVVVISLFTGFLKPDGRNILSGFADANPVFAPLVPAFILLGLVLGGFFMAGIHYLTRARASALFVTLLSSISLIALYYYVLSEQMRDPILIVTVALMIGSLGYAVLFPESVTNLVNP